MLTQVRYLGVFETIQIRQKTFPARKTYPDFINAFQPLFHVQASNDRDLIRYMLLKAKAKERDYLLGSKRVYMSRELEDSLNRQLYEFFKLKNEKAQKIQRAFRRYRMRVRLAQLARRTIVFRRLLAQGLLRAIARKYFKALEVAIRQ